MLNRRTLRNLLATVCASALTAGLAMAAGSKANAPRDMKLLVVAVDGNEPDYAALKFFVETLGIPYQTVFTLDTSVMPPVSRPLPPLTDGAKGYFQGIILTNGKTSYCYVPGPGLAQVCVAGLTPESWSELENYAREFDVRIASYYTYPEPRYGIATDPQRPGGDSSIFASFTGPAASLFPYLNTVNPLKIEKAWTYFAQAAPMPGETTAPFLMSGNSVLGAVHTKADGREYLALTMANNPNLRHSLILNYGILNWVMKGIFIGGRRVYVTPQVDDYFLSNELFVKGNTSCAPASFITDPTYQPAGTCPTLRITGSDLSGLAAWQTNWNRLPQFQRFRVTHSFNGRGAVDNDGNLAKDDLLVQSIALRAKFYWLNHTWDHQDLDCYRPTPNAGAAMCRGVTQSQADNEIQRNLTYAQLLGIPVDRPSVVTPALSGTKNPAFLNAALSRGIRYLTLDTSRSGSMPAIPNTGIVNPLAPSMLLIPRRPANIFFNTVTPAEGANGSLVDEYNHFFGPSGIVKINETTPFFATPQSYDEIIDTESDNLLTYMLRAEIYPHMYHQSNLHLYNGQNSLFSDVHDAAFAKFAKISNLPVISLTQSDIGREMESKMAVINAQVTGVLTPGSGITLTGKGGANVPITGICLGTSCESYGGQCLSKVPLRSTTRVTVNFASTARACAVNPGLPDVPVPAALATPVSAPNAQLQNIAALQQQLSGMLENGELTGGDGRRYDGVYYALTDSMDSSLWLNGDHLNPTEGDRVFDAHRAAVYQLTLLLKERNPVGSGSAISAVVNVVVEIDRVLAQTAVAAAQAFAPKSEYVTNALDEMTKAAEAISNNDQAEAIDHYRKAWKAAEDAMDLVGD